MRFVDYLAKRLNRRAWVLAERMTPRLRREGYDIALSLKLYEQLELDWAKEYPTAVLESMPANCVRLLEAAGLLNLPKES